MNIYQVRRLTLPESFYSYRCSFLQETGEDVAAKRHISLRRAGRCAAAYFKLANDKDIEAFDINGLVSSIKASRERAV